MNRHLLLFAFAFVSACDNDGDERSCEVDAPWSCDDQVDMISQAECGGPPEGEATYSLVREEQKLSLRVSDFAARCAQDLCAFVHESAETVDVLIQPCDLHPKMVTRCSCAHDLTIDLGPVEEEGVTIEVYERRDEYTMPTRAEKVATLREDGPGR